MATSIVVGLHTLGRDVDLVVGGRDVWDTANALRQRWHLALRDQQVRQPGAPVINVELIDVQGSTRMSDRDLARGAIHLADSELSRLLQRTTQSVTQALVAEQTGRLLMLHAAGLANPQTGATAAFVAPGNTGKTTLCRTLGTHGFAYVTDETVGIRRNGAVVPYPKPLSVRRSDWNGVKDEQAPQSLGLHPTDVTPWVAGLVLLRRSAAHRGPVIVEELNLLDAVEAIVPETSAFMETTAPLQWLADILQRTGGARAVTYAEAKDLVPLVAELCDRDSPW